MSTDLSADLKRLRQILDEIADLKGEGARVIYRLGVLLREVEDGELWRAAGARSYSAWLEEHAQIGRTSAHRAVTVARHFNEDIAVRYGQEKLYQGLRYLELTARDEQPGDLIAMDIRLRDARGRYVSVPFHEATQREVQDAVALLSRRKRVRARADDALLGRMSRLASALPAPPEGMRPVAERVQFQQTRDGKVALSFRQIPLDELEAFLEAVRRELLG